METTPPQTFPSEEAAASDFRDTISRILTCIDRRIVAVSSQPDAAKARTLTIAGGSAYRLRTVGGGNNLALRVTMLFETTPVANRWRTHTKAYYYTIEDVSGAKIISWEWHPHAREAGERIITHPHIHIAAGAGRGLRQEFSRAHLVTNRVALEQVLACIIEDFHVVPGNPAYMRVFNRTLARFSIERSWSGEYTPT